ncbi:hypothetical protein PTE30175_02138 [Pandoraea terrae]|uniref:Uncharacterized protein n=1 Tax=Pandoraea terrae TaxID=1537710 RepID=A0A5E4UUF5_9BURK|nr:right-handed parallel beta-helix repeat-containing protein [Pandoraea terrae]VVE02545.1 hypothetical protein PTE30175_02138 [Pandoraea terrae]
MKRDGMMPAMLAFGTGWAVIRRAGRACLHAGVACVVSISVGGACAQTLALRIVPDAAGGSVQAPASAEVPDKPLTLDAALTWLRQPKPRASVDHLKLVFAPGHYRVNGPMNIAPHTSWRGTPIDILGAETGATVISGGRIVRGFAPVTDPAVLARLTPAARPHVKVALLAASGVSDVGTFVRHGFGLPSRTASLEVFFRGRPMTLARWPNDGFARIDALPDGPQGRRFTVTGAHLAAWQAEPALRATGYWARDWADTTLALTSVDPSAGTMTIEGPPPQFGLKAGQRVVIENALSELDTPGEWYLDAQAGKLYFWPPDTLRDGDVEVSMADTLLTMRGVSQVTIRQLVFEMCRGIALDMRGVDRVSVTQSVIRNAGGSAAVLEGRDSGFSEVRIEDTGEGGITLSGGNRKTLAPGNLFVERSVIRTYARRAHAYRPAVAIMGVGNRVTDSHLFDGPHTAIIYGGNDHLIARNEIDHVVQETGDAGAVYTGRDWTARGTIIEDNFFHDVGWPGHPAVTMGIYLDDQASGTVIRRNLFAHVGRAVFVGGGRDNLVQDNLFVSSSPAMHVDARGVTWQRGMSDDPNGPLRRLLTEFDTTRPPYATRYPALAGLLGDTPGAPKGNVIRRNIVLDGNPLSVEARALPYVEIGEMFGASDVLFVQAMPDASRGAPEALRLAPDAPVLRKGFEVSRFVRPILRLPS